MRTLRSAAALLLVAMFSIAGRSAAQEVSPVTVPHTDARVRAAMDYLARVEPATIERQIEICEIPAPPFLEAERAADFVRRMEALGLENVRIDAEGNAIGERPGEADGPTVVLSAHLDTVFPEGTDVTVTREGPILRGPGIGDDCRGLTIVLAVAEALREHRIPTRGRIIFVGTVGEEGPGNLRGVRHLFEQELRDRVDYFISVDGTGLGLTTGAVGSYRYTVTFRGPGGHSYGAFGIPNPAHALGRAIAKIADFQVQEEPKVTFSVGLLEGGTSVNSIPFEASMQVDMRSIDPAALDELDARFQRAVQEALTEENARWGSETELTVELDRWGLRPAGQQADSDPIVRAAVGAGRALGFTPPIGASSTDANLPISLGIPAITIDGGGRGGGAHSLDEWFDTTDSRYGTQWALLVTLTLAGVR